MKRSYFDVSFWKIQGFGQGFYRWQRKSSKSCSCYTMFGETNHCWYRTLRCPSNVRLAKTQMRLFAMEIMIGATIWTVLGQLKDIQKEVFQVLVSTVCLVLLFAESDGVIFIKILWLLWGASLFFRKLGKFYLALNFWWIRLKK